MFGAGEYVYKSTRYRSSHIRHQTDPLRSPIGLTKNRVGLMVCSHWLEQGLGLEQW